MSVTGFQRETIKGNSRVVPCQALCHKGICASGGMDSCFLALVQIQMNGQLYVVAAVVKEKRIQYLSGKWVDPRTSLDVEAKRKVSAHAMYQTMVK